MLKILTVHTLALLAAACSSSPSKPGSGDPPSATTVPVAAAVASAAPVTTPAPAPATPATKPTKRLMSGFTLVMKNGAPTYCRDDLKTGSHIVTQRTCLSQREYDSLEEDTRRDVDRIRNTINPMMGSTGGSSH